MQLRCGGKCLVITAQSRYSKFHNQVQTKMETAWPTACLCTGIGPPLGIKVVAPHAVAWCRGDAALAEVRTCTCNIFPAYFIPRKPDPLHLWARCNRIYYTVYCMFLFLVFCFLFPSFFLWVVLTGSYLCSYCNLPRSMYLSGRNASVYNSDVLDCYNYQSSKSGLM